MGIRFGSTLASAVTLPGIAAGLVFIPGPPNSPPPLGE
jgi:hypothetical protein